MSIDVHLYEQMIICAYIYKYKIASVAVVAAIPTAVAAADLAGAAARRVLTMMPEKQSE